MAQLFPRSSNALAKASIVVVVALVGALFATLYVLDRSTYTTRANVTIKQPVPFSHDHHTVTLGIDCRYCHTSAEVSGPAGIPPTATCMNCHKLIWNQSPMLEPVRESFRTNTPIRWVRVHDLPDYVYFNHSIHVAKGVACVTCHGRVDEMPLIHQVNSLQMSWCVDCHRDTSKFQGPRSAVFRMPAQAEFKPVLADTPKGADGVNTVNEPYRVRQLTSCSTCHR